MNSAWANFYRDRLNDKYFELVCDKYLPFIREIQMVLDASPADPVNVTEFGCGIGTITKALMNYSSLDNYTVIDNDQLMLELTKKNLEHSPEADFVIYIQDDIRNAYNVQGKIAHSHGVLEHFSDQEIRLILNQQKKNFKYLIHYVPSAKYEEPSFGDERLMTPKQWYDICQPDEIIEFNDGYDLILKWRL